MKQPFVPLKKHEFPVEGHAPQGTTERRPEQAAENIVIERETEVATTTQTQPSIPEITEQPLGPAAQKDPDLVTIENILAAGMEEFFLSLNQLQQQNFKASGEAAAVKIKSVIVSGKYRIKDIVGLIVGWLKTLPGLNRFFLEQEAKIKADKIVDHFEQR